MLRRIAQAIPSLRKARRTLVEFSQRDELVTALYRNLFERYRLRLPQIAPEALAPEIDFVKLPAIHPLFAGEDAPLLDLFFLLSVAKARAAARILEVGTYRARSTLALHQNCPEARIVSYDVQILPSPYRKQVEQSPKVELRHASFSAAGDTLRSEEPFDLVFIDGSHRVEAVIEDSRLAFDIVNPDGLILWHDYRRNGYYTPELRVPEGLEAIREEKQFFEVQRTTFAAYGPNLHLNHGS